MWILLSLFLSINSQARTVHYDLDIAKHSVNLSGAKEVDFAIEVNGSIPAPLLEFTEGDDAEIVVKNSLPVEEASIHWHGILLPNLEDGVPYVSTPPIPAGTSRAFRFKIRQHGTYWYHSHTGLQEQKGVFGPIVIHPAGKKASIPEAVAILSDWSDENPDQILRNLKKDGDYYLAKKGSIRSYVGALKAGGLGVQLANEWQRMGGMDISDVGYDAFLINGKRDSQLYSGAEKVVRVRLINAGSSSYFYVSAGQQKMRVIAADGIDIEPVETKELLMGMAETYDVEVPVPAGKSVELRATAQDVTGFASAWLGTGEKIFAPTKVAPGLYESMDHAHMNHAAGAMNMTGHEHMHHHAMGVESLTVDDISAKEATVFSNSTIREVKLVLGGDMQRYVWHINGKPIHEESEILVKEGEVVRFVFENETMMHHPMHLHGHFFRVLNKFGEKSPWKHTVDVPPHGKREIEFKADAPGNWMIHCHNLFHMHSGMGRVITYLDFVPAPEVKGHHGHDPHMHDPVYWNGMVEAASNHGKLEVRASNTRSALELRAEARDKKNGNWTAEGDLLFRRWTSQYFSILGGATEFDDRVRATVGASYILPMLVEAQVLVDHKGEFRGDLRKKFQWTSWLFSDAEITFRQKENTEFEVSLMWGPNWHWALGAMVTENKIGGGAQYKF